MINYKCMKNNIDLFPSIDKFYIFAIIYFNL